jgi:hypothetical protein
MQMREELLATLATNIEDILAERREDAKQARVDALVVRFGVIARWIGSDSVLLNRWTNILTPPSLPDGKLQRILRELNERLANPPNPILVFFQSSLPFPGERVTSDSLPDLLNRVVKEGAALTQDPPWPPSEAPVITCPIPGIQKLRIALCDATLERMSTEDLFASLKRTFDSIVSRGLARPKVWIVPTVNRSRLVVLMGEPDALRELLRDVHSHLIQLVDS